jgi:molybdate-binding protein
LRDNLLVSGCDPGLGLLAAHCNEQRRRGKTIHIEAASGQSLRYLAERSVHVAGLHSGGHVHHELTRSALRAALPQTAVAVFELARWELGLVVARGNPKALRGVADLAQPEVRLINRAPAAAARQLLDQLLTEAHVPVSAVCGYENHARGHLAVAQAVAWGLADAGIATAHAAAAWDLAFVPLAEDCFELAVPARDCEDRRVAALLDTARSTAFRREAGRIAGYDASHSGEGRGVIG